MSAKLLHALSDDNPELKKQIGCLNGIFQLFDRQHFLTGKRITGHSHKRFPQGHSHLSNGNLGGGSHNELCIRTTTEKNLSKNVNENQRDSVESSRPSFSSSSCSSSFSSVDCNKAAKPEPPSGRLRRRSLDFQDTVKDSIYREARVSPVKTTAKEEPVSRAVKHRDSPRPVQLPKSVDGSFEVAVNGKQRVPIDLKDSPSVFANFQEVPRYFNNSRELRRSSYEVRDGTSFSAPKDAPRFSYDGRERPRSSFESRDRFKSTTKLRELPRLSLDSRESSMKVSDASPKSNSTLKDFQSGSGNSNKTSSPQKELECHKKHPSVVAKLMGLDAMPSSILASEGQMGQIKTFRGEDHGSFSRSSEMTNECKQNGISNSPRSSLKDPVSPRLRNHDVVMKPISSSRFPIEQAPWRQLDGGRSLPKPTFRNREIHTRVPNGSPSVYAEIEKRLKELEFKQSDKDLRALKQILDAIQMKGLLETKKDQDQAFISETSCDNQNQTSLDQNLRLANRRNSLTKHPISATKGTRLKTFESPIVIMKPAKLIEKSRIPASSVIPIDRLSGPRKLQSDNSVDNKKVSVNSRTPKDPTPKLSFREAANKTLRSTDKEANGRTSRPSQTSSSSQQFPRENTGSSGRSSVSPRLQQKKFELDRQSRSPTPPSDLSRPRRQSGKQLTESGSPGGKCRPSCPNVQLSNDQFSEISSETRNLSRQGDEISVSDSNISLASQIDIEVTSADRSAEIKCIFFQQGSQSPSKKVDKDLVSSFKQRKPSAKLSEDGSVSELTAISPEQPSPVSVLDAPFYRDDLPSGKKISEPFKDDGSRNSDESPGEDEWNPVDDSTRPNLSFGVNRKKLENIEHLVQKLRRLNSNHDEATTDYIASLCENTNPDNRYISEILLASGLLLRDLGSGLATIQLHSPGYPINPDLFFVLEQTKVSTGLLKDEHYCEKVVSLKSDQERVHRKLVFDAVNEILGQKLALVGPSPELWIHVDRLPGRTLNAQQLLRELCSEILQLQANENLDWIFDDDDNGLKTILFKDVMHQSENWTDFQKEFSGLVLDVERSIFKGLVDEIVSDEAVSLHLQAKPNRRCRQLFAK